MNVWWDIVEWEGQSGSAYLYTSVPIGTPLTDEPGNYLFARFAESGEWVPLYVGETVSLRAQVDSGNEHLPCVREHGGTHVHFRHNPEGHAARVEEVDDLIALWQPPCNADRSGHE